MYFYYIDMTGEPHAYHASDELTYQYWGSLWRESGFDRMKEEMSHIALSDRGYPWLLGFEYLLFGTHVLPARIIKCILSAFSCVLMYNLARRNFGEAVGRMTGILCMLIPNMWHYCSITLKETEMAFMVILFMERVDLALRYPKISLVNFLLPGVVILVMFTFRTALAGVLVAALVAALIMSSGKQLQTWKKVLYSALFAVWMFFTVGAEIVE
jgi:4-amino-4-deoxy-L-arabinose transferase-like glycosyltransferase